MGRFYPDELSFWVDAKCIAFRLLEKTREDNSAVSVCPTLALMMASFSVAVIILLSLTCCSALSSKLACAST